jgi:hypothetical protein
LYNIGMSVLFRYLHGHCYEPDLLEEPEDMPDIVYQVRLKIVLKKLLKKKDTFSDMLETLMYSFDMKMDHNGELIATSRRDGALSFPLPIGQGNRRQTYKFPQKK